MSKNKPRNKADIVKKILDIPELSQYIPPEVFHNFITKQNYLKKIADEYRQECQASLNSLISGSMDDYDESKGNVIMSQYSISAAKEVLNQNSQFINTDKLALFLIARVDSMLTLVNNLLSGKSAEVKREVEEAKGNKNEFLCEIYFENGDYLVITGDDCYGEINGRKIASKKNIDELEQFMDKLAIATIKGLKEMSKKSRKETMLTNWKTKNAQKIYDRIYSQNSMDYLLIRGLLMSLLDDRIYRRRFFTKLFIK